MCEGEFDWKVKMRYFNTPDVISTYVEGPSVALCWKKNGKIGDHTHIYWDCTKIQEFWKNVKKEMIPIDPVVCLLGALPKKMYNEEKRYVLRILLLIAKKMITTLDGRRPSQCGSVDSETETGLDNDKDWMSTNEDFSAKMEKYYKIFIYVI